MKIQCIYKITNNVNGKIYIGSSSNLLTRWNAHLECLIKNKHNNKFLQNDFNIHGVESFTFNIEQSFYSLISKKELLSIEADYILKYKSLNKDVGYNINLPVFKSDMRDKIDAPISNHHNKNVSDENTATILKNIKIHTLTKEKHFDSLKDKQSSYNHSWFIKNDGVNCDRARKVIINFYRNIVNAKGCEFYWTSYSDIKDNLNSKGFIKCYTNETDVPKHKRNKLAFMMNPQLNPFSIDLCNNNIDKETYGLNILLSWINNVSDITKPIDIFIPNPILAKQLMDLQYKKVVEVFTLL